MKVLSHTGNQVYIGHFQGNAMKHYLDEVAILSNIQVSIAAEISVITIFSDKESALTALQLENCGIAYTNAYRPIGKRWSNVDKIKLFAEQLAQTQTPYTLLVDAHDVLFLKDLDQAFIQKFQAFNKRVVYNATKNNYPNFDIDHVEDREQLGDFKYLNAGVVFGETQALLALYQEMIELIQSKEIVNPWESEQLYVRIAANGKEHVGFDHNCVLFQTFAKTQKTNLGNTLIIT